MNTTQVNTVIVQGWVSRANEVISGFKRVRDQQARDVLTVAGELTKSVDENVGLKVDNDIMRKRIVELEQGQRDLQQKLREKK